MTRVGYRKTAPARVYVDFSREALEAIGDTNFSLYEDPLDLKNTLKSFSFTMTKGDVPGMMQFDLINPGQQVEEKLFAWFASVNPRTWRAKQDAPNPEKAQEYWSTLAQTYARFFVRWGYVSDPEDGDSPSVALSHIHEMFLYNVGYEISDKQDRIVTLQMQTYHDISLLRQMDFASKSLSQPVKTPIIGDDGALREPAEIVSDFIARLSSGGGNVGGCFLSEEQAQIINEKFDVLGTRDLPGPDDVDYLDNAEYDPETQSGKRSGYSTLRRFFNGLGVDIHVEPANDPSPAPEETIAPAQVPELAPANVSTKAVEQLVDSVDDNFLVPRIVIATSAIDLERNRTTTPATPGPIGNAILINPFKPIKETVGNSYVLEDVYPDRFTYFDLMTALEQDWVYLMPEDRAEFQAVTPVHTDLLAVSENINVGNEQYARSFKYKPSEHRELRLVIELMLENTKAKLDGVKDEQKVEEIQQELRDEAQILLENPVKKSDPIPRNFNGSYISITTPHRDITLRKFLDIMNTTFFDGTSDYIQCTHIPTAAIETKDREAFQRRFAQADIKWDKDTGVNVAGTLGFLNRLLNFMGKIDSFDIQVPDKPERVVFSTGFSKNKTNIITDLSYRQTKRGWYSEFLMSPIIMQQVYSIAQRFETKEYRDVVLQQLELEIDPDGKPVIIRVYPDSEDKDTSVRAFPEDLANRVFAAAARSVTDTDYVEDSSVTDEARLKILRQVAEDLAFLKDNNLIEAFFPTVSKDMIGSEDARAYIGIERKRVTKFRTVPGPAGAGGAPLRIPIGEEVVIQNATRSFGDEGQLATELLDQKTYRFLANSPLQNLLEKPDTEEANELNKAVLLAQKMRALQAFKKGIVNVRFRTLGVPEMDVLSYETGQRRVSLIVSEPRVPGTYHWLTGVYYPIDIIHRIDVDEGYTTEFELLVSDSNTQEELLEASFTFLESIDD